MISPAQRRLLTVAAVLNAFTYAIIVFFIGITLPNLSAIFALSESQKGSLFLDALFKESRSWYLNTDHCHPLDGRVTRDVLRSHTHVFSCSTCLPAGLKSVELASDMVPIM